MTLFLMACGGLLVFSALFYLLPRDTVASAPERGDAQANLDWYRLRQNELKPEERETLEDDMALRLLEDEPSRESRDVPMVAAGQTFPRWLLLPVITLAASSLYYYLGAAPDVMIQQQMASISNTSEPEQLQALFEAVEKRAEQRPDNLHYSALLGRFYMDRQDYERAAQLYGDLAQVSAGDAQAFAYAAQAEYLARGRKLNERAQLFAERALAIDPGQSTALGLLGMVFFEQENYRAALEYWQRLVAAQAPGSANARMIEGVMAQAREKLAAAGQAGPSQVPVSQPVTAGVSIRVSFPKEAQINPDDTVFVLARAAQAKSRMPVAVVRLQAGQLPAEVRLDDSQSMAGQKLSALESIVVVVQVSPDGRPGEASATWLGSVGPLNPSMDSDPIEVVLTPR